MGRRNESRAETRPQYRTFGLLAVVVVGFTAILTLTAPQVFRPYFGGRNPILVVLGIVVLGASFVTLVLAREWFVVYEPGALRRRLVPVVVVPTLLAAGMALVDSVAVFPEDINVLVPNALLFYPTIAFVVEVLFHLVPLSLALLVVSTAFGTVDRRVDRRPFFWAVVVAVALLEPAFQLQLGFSNAVPSWAVAYVAANVFIINLTQLYLFARADFLTMFSFRLVYYLQWHIVWGTVRLQVLF